MKKCHACGEPWEETPGSQPGKSETCTKCGADLHCCLNCKLYAPPAHHECRSPTAEYVKDKEKRNHCDEFEFSEKGKGGGDSPKGDMENKWKDLFNE